MHSLCDETHILIAGTTGSGKSVLINNLLYCLTSYDPTQQKLILIDLKRVELAKWQAFPHVLETVTEPEDVLGCLDRLIAHMDKRYKRLMQAGKTQSRDCYIHLIIDELAEVLRVKGAEERIDTLLRLARAANVRLIMATQNPSRSSGIPARLYQNVTCTIGLRCKSATESRQVIGVKGCETLPKFGYCYIQNSDGLKLAQIPYIPDADIQIQLCSYLYKVG